MSGSADVFVLEELHGVAAHWPRSAPKSAAPIVLPNDDDGGGESAGGALVRVLSGLVVVLGFSGAAWALVDLALGAVCDELGDGRG